MERPERFVWLASSKSRIEISYPSRLTGSQNSMTLLVYPDPGQPVYQQFEEEKGLGIM